MNITAKFWDRAARDFDQKEARYPQMHARTVEKARKYLKSTDLVLDFGCATGIKTLELVGHVKEIRGIDISPKMIAAANQNADERNIRNVDFTEATIFDHGLTDGSFDVILAFGILHLLKNLPQALERINQLLKPDGWFISSTACMRREDPILNWMNHLLFIPARIGILPTLQFLKIPELEQAIDHTGFMIVETETIPFDPIDSPTYIVGHFIAAKKVSCNQAENCIE